MGIAHIKLVHQRTGLIGVDDHDFAGRVGTGEDPDSAAHGVNLMHLLGM